MSRDIGVIQAAEDLCTNPRECLTTIFTRNYTTVVSHLRQVKLARYQVNVMMIPVGQLSTPVPLYCPFYAIKFKIVNMWSSHRESLLFQNTKTECGHPLKGDVFLSVSLIQ